MLQDIPIKIISVFVFLQAMKTDMSDSVAKIQTLEANHQEAFSQCIQSQQETLTEHCKGISDWSSQTKRDLTERDEDVAKFVTEELKRNVPTGLYGYYECSTVSKRQFEIYFL